MELGALQNDSCARTLWRAALGGALAVGLSTAPAAAGQAAYGTVYNVMPYLNGSGLMFFSQAGSTTGHPACATQPRWVINLSTPGGQAAASTIITAYATGKPIAVTGTGSCADWGDTESILFVVTQ